MEGFKRMSKNMTSLEISKLPSRRKSPIKNRLLVISEAGPPESILTSRSKDTRKSKAFLSKSTSKLGEPQEVHEKFRSGRIRKKAKDEFFSIVKKRSSKRKKKKEKLVGCNCTINKCIQMYCRCFKMNSFCGPQCNCQGCVNNPDNSAIMNTLKGVLVEKDEMSFTKRFKTVKVKVENAEGQFVEEGSCNSRAHNQHQRVQLSQDQMSQEVLRLL